ncbi:MAG: hypothetical protein M0Z41_13840 [Peptococcaceae bacterium]|jgi:hypothetical protein|nr:hypothetical protein [Peptococcaceae bacterium]
MSEPFFDNLEEEAFREMLEMFLSGQTKLSATLSQNLREAVATGLKNKIQIA